MAACGKNHLRVRIQILDRGANTKGRLAQGEKMLVADLMIGKRSGKLRTLLSPGQWDGEELKKTNQLRRMRR